MSLWLLSKEYFLTVVCVIWNRIHGMPFSIFETSCVNDLLVAFTALNISSAEKLLTVLYFLAL